MTKNDFLDTLGKRLAQALPQEKVAEHIQYYDSYFTDKLRSGMSEEEAVEQLGDPLLIAKTIMSTERNSDHRKVIYEENPEKGNEWTAERDRTNEKNRNHQVSIHTRGGCLAAVILLVLVLILLLWLVGSVVSFVLPVLLPLLVIALVILCFKKK